MVHAHNISLCQDCLRNNVENVWPQDAIQTSSGKSAILSLSWRKTNGEEREWTPADVINLWNYGSTTTWPEASDTNNVSTTERPGCASAAWLQRKSLTLMKASPVKVRGAKRSFLPCKRAQWCTQKIFMGGGSFSGIWWSFLFGVRCLRRHNLTSYSCFQAKFVDIIGIIFYTHSPYFCKNQALYTRLTTKFL